MFVETKDCDLARKYWHEKGDEMKSLDQDNLFINPEDLAHCGFQVYLHEQKCGELIIIPSECAHQVLNSGSRPSIKIAWNRTNTSSLNRSLGSLMKVYKRYQLVYIYV